MHSAEANTGSRKQSGLYTHIPWCRQICHYCDFAKTANHSDGLRQMFITHLESHYRIWLNWYRQHCTTGGSERGIFDSVFFGGGTPSIYTYEYAPLFEQLRPFIDSATEITLEANPDDITIESLKIWRSLGFNRLSLGVQTFDSAGLKAMHRVHTSLQAQEAVRLALAVFPTVNLDLIYGWNGQTQKSWENDLETAVDLGVPHLSLYNLTYEPRTVIGRMAARGKITPTDDECLERYYETARSVLAASGFDHEEVSNWSRNSPEDRHSCIHNWLYWSDQPYIGIGPGAHGYLHGDSIGNIGNIGNIGTRYAYPRNERLFSDSIEKSTETSGTGLPLAAGIDPETDRTMASWIIETVGSSFRTNRGVNLDAITAKSGLVFKPVDRIKEGLDKGILRLSDGGGVLTATPAEWFREHYWALGVIESF